MSDNDLQYGNVSSQERQRRRRRIDSSDSDSIITNVSSRRRAYRIASDSGEFSGSSNSSEASSTNSGHVTYTKRKRNNPYTLLSDIDSSSSSNSDSDIVRIHTKKRLAFIIDDMSSPNSSSSDSDIQRPSSSSRRPPPRVVSDNEDDDDDVSAAVNSSRATSESPIPARNPRILRLVSSDEEHNFSLLDDSEDDSWNESEELGNQPKKSKTGMVIPDSGSSSSSSDCDEQTECCPICFRKLKNQEIGTPESCDHTFCVACLKEWAKNVNTCPVDRQRFALILVRKTPGGKIIEQIPVQTVEPENNTVEDDPTYCEICGQCDREDRMMLCDGCDLGYHLECLTPPLQTIPIAEWFCPNCTLIYAIGDHFEELSTDFDVDDDLYAGRRGQRGRRRVHYLRQAHESSNEESESTDNLELRTRSSFRRIHRLIPRTRQSQRIMNSLMSTVNLHDDEPSSDDNNSDGDFEDVENTDVTTQASQPAAKKQRKPRHPAKCRRKTSRRKRKNCRFKIKLITTEEGVIEVKLPKKRKRRYRRKTKRTRWTGERGQGRVRVSQKRTVKERLAQRLGIMCNNRRASTQPAGQNEPQAMAQPHSSSHSSFRQAIPTLDLFGARDQLDYFSGASDEDDMNFGGSNDFGEQLLTQRSQRSSITSDLRVMSRKKAAAVLTRSQQQARSATSKKVASAPSTATGSGGSLLDSILDSQTKWHSKNSEIIHNRTDGSLTVKVKDKKIDVNKENAKATETPLYPGSSNPHGSRFSNYDYQSRDKNVSGVNRPTDVQSSSSGSSSSFSSSNLSNFSSPRGGGFSSNYGVGVSPFTGAAPIRFRMNLPPRRPNIHSAPVIPPLTEPPFPDPQLFAPDPSPSNSPNEDEEVDIYSDIEPERADNDGEEGGDRNYGTLEPPPEPPALLMGLGQDDIDEENDEGGLVIDDQPLPPTQQMPPPPPPPADVYDPCESSDDSNSSDAFHDEKNHPNYGMYPTVGPIPEIVSSSKSPHSDEDEQNGDEADCPNFSMYSAASMNLARKNDEMQVKGSVLVDYDDDDDDSFLSVDGKDKNKIDDDDIGDVPLPPDEKDDHGKDNDNRKKENVTLSDKSGAEDRVVGKVDKLDVMRVDQDDCAAVKDLNENTSDIPIPEDLKEEDIPIPADINNEDIPVPESSDKINENAELDTTEEPVIPTTEEKDDPDEEDEGEDGDKEISVDNDNANEEEEEEDEEDNGDGNNDGESACKNISSDEVEQIKIKTAACKISGTKDTDEGEDECSTQDVLDLAIGSEGNLQDNLNNDENEEPSISIHVENPEELEDGIDKVPDAGEKPDGLVDITDEEMSVYDGQDNSDNLEKLSDNDKEHGMVDNQKDIDMFDSDDNSLVGGATSAVSAGTLNNSDNQQVLTLPGLEGLETETISESEDVNFDELPEGIQNEDRSIQTEEDYSSLKRKKKKKARKTTSMSETEDAAGKGQLDMLEFEEGEIIEDKPKQSLKKDKKSKGKHEKEVTDKEEVTVAAPAVTTPQVTKEPVVADKKQKKKKDKKDLLKDKSVVSGTASKSKEPKMKEKTVKTGEVDENIAWKKPSKSTKERNYRDGKEKEKDDKKQEPAKKEKKNKEKRKELERYDVRRLISEKPKRPRKDEFGRDLSPSKSHSLTPPRFRNRSPLRVRNRTRSRSWRSRSRSRGRIRRSRSRGRFRSRSRDRGRSKSRERLRRSRSRRRTRSKERRRSKSKEKASKPKKRNSRTASRTRRRTKSRTPQRPNRRPSRSYSQSWSPSWSRSSVSRSRSASPRTGRTRSLSRSLSRSWSRGREGRGSLVDVGHKNTRKNLTVIVPNKDAVRKKDKKKTVKKKDDKRKRRRGQSPAPSKEVFTSGDNILVSVNFKSNRGAAEIVPATTPVLRESSKRKRDDIDPVTGKRKKDKSSKENVPLRNKSGQKGLLNKSNRLNKLNEVTKNAKPVAVIDLDLSPFREQTPSPKEVIILSDSGEENDKQQKEMEKQLERLGEGLVSSRLSMDTDHQQNTSISQLESPSTHSFMMTSTGPKTPPEPHVKFSIVSNKPQLRVMTNPLMECDEELRRDEATETDMEEVMHKGPNTPPEPPPDLNTPASPPTTPYDPFDPTKSRSPSPQPPSDSGMQVSSSREEKSTEISSNLQEADEAHGGRMIEHRTLTPPVDADELKKTPEPLKVLSTPKVDQSGAEISPKHQSPGSIAVEQSKIVDDSLLKPFQKLLNSASKIDVPVHKSPDKMINVSQQIKSLNQTPSKQLGVIKKAASLIPVYTPSMTLNSNKAVRTQQNGGTGDPSEDVLDLDAGSPYSPGSSEGDDLFDPPPMTPPRTSKPLPTSASKAPQAKGAAPTLSIQNKFDQLFSASPMKLPARHGKHHGKTKKGAKGKSKGGTGKKEVGVKLDEDQLKILDDLPSSAVEMQFLKKLNRQERVVEEVKLVLKPHYAKKHISKEDYKEILRRAVPKICHNKSGEINPIKIQFLIEAYVRKFRKLGAAKKKPAAGNQNAVPKPKLQKTMWS